jgi:hypothetical protein
MDDSVVQARKLLYSNLTIIMDSPHDFVVEKISLVIEK